MDESTDREYSDSKIDMEVPLSSYTKEQLENDASHT